MTQGGHALLHWLGRRRFEDARAPTKTERAEPQRAETERAEPNTAWTAEALHQHFLADVFCYVARRVPHVQEAEDVTAEVFAAAFIALPRRLGPHGPYPWLLGIARRKIADSHRRRTRHGGPAEVLADDVPAASADLPEARLAQGERQRFIREMVTKLPAGQREALLLHYVEELSQAEIAVVLGRSPAAINSLLQRARAAVYHQGRSYFLDESEATE